ncbi:6-phosphogluconolactonase [Mesorhizobium sp. Root554]|uniref:6-phosphogluconolactonase n=1 Tax=unclassified Mesorhizobium TaxID=325217 RepID=UPI0006F6F05C|nr:MULTISPECIES: 6-phosphogluconolactonase [unclassified Mesorhizobium]KQZ15675.1 6-phosphogluconolactonase [Mesorhizobium sp. Root1471]KQZ38183.1 6-phosphogluconolactonase [Mesorhizobium sp. Root554]
MSATYQWNAFPDRQSLAEAFATRIAGLLQAAVDSKAGAVLAVSGGSTPGRFFTALSKVDINWSKVTVTLVDERFVPPTSPRSNAALVAANLLQNKAAAARFVPLYHADEDVAVAAAEAGATINKLPLPFDAVVLGMGTDGHTASFFPDAEHLDVLLDPASGEFVMPVQAQSAGEPRLTLSLAPIVAAGFLALHIEGEEKREVFETVMGAGEIKPIRAVIEASPRTVQVFWAP